MNIKYFSVRGVEVNNGVEYPIKEVIKAKNMGEAAEKIAAIYAEEPDGEFELNMNGLPIVDTENGKINIERVKTISKSQFDQWSKLENALFSLE